LEDQQRAQYWHSHGNVKRVLARFYEVEGWYGKKPVASKLWELAEANTPKTQVDVYTQAIMDFGATLCTRSKPDCNTCPLQNNCQAFAKDRVNELPHGKPKTNKPTKQTYMLLVKNQTGEFLLQQNPPARAVVPAAGKRTHKKIKSKRPRP